MKKWLIILIVILGVWLILDIPLFWIIHTSLAAALGHFYFNSVSNIKISDDTVEFILLKGKSFSVSKSQISVIETIGTGYNFYLSNGQKLMYRYIGNALWWKRDIELDKLICPQNFPFAKFDSKLLWRKELDMKEAVIDLTNCKGFVELHIRIQEALDFPEWYGKNWDAFWDLLHRECDYDFISVVGADTVAKELKPKIEIMKRLIRNGRK